MSKKNKVLDQIRCVFDGDAAEACPPPEKEELPVCINHIRKLNDEIDQMNIPDHIRESILKRGSDSFIFNRQNGTVYSLNATGAFFLREIISGKDTRAILDNVRRDFEVDSMRDAAKDLHSFLNELQKIDLA
ncbi:MAG: PqqD family protein [Deltaproteobacteria bacterium]|nr:PqqD family protein [Deltaproteobacteria bacterium]